MEKILAHLQHDEVIFMHTDTIPGLVCSALSPTAIDKIYKLKNRDSAKPPTILIAGTEQLDQLGITLTSAQKLVTAKYWPGPYSLIFDCDPHLTYLHRGKNSLAVRLPASANLRTLLRISGPLATSSANPQGASPALNTVDAKKYFKNSIDYYSDVSSSSPNPSTIIRVSKDGSEEKLR